MLQKKSRSNPVVLVTGGAGYIGSHTCSFLKAVGFNPVVYDSLEFGKQEAVQWGPFVNGNLLDPDKLEETFHQYDPAVVLHLGAIGNVGRSVQDPRPYYSANIAGSINLLNVMRRHDTKSIVFSSSCTVYGESSGPIREDAPKAPVNAYARSKLVIEDGIRDYAQAYGMNYMILRYFNAAGIAAGMLPRPPSTLIQKIFLSAQDPTQPFQIFGSDYSTPDGTAIRDYIHVNDLARANVLAVQHLLSGKPSNILNIGSGKGYSVLEVIRAAEKIINQTIPYTVNPRRAGDVSQAAANIEKAREVLDFEPQESNLTTILFDELNNKNR